MCLSLASGSGRQQQRAWIKLRKEIRRGGLPGGPVSVLTVYPQHGTVVAAVCHSQIHSRGPFMSVALLPSLSQCSSLTFFLFSLHPPPFLFISQIPLFSASLLLLCQVLRRESERAGVSSCCGLSTSTSSPPSVLYSSWKGWNMQHTLSSFISRERERDRLYSRLNNIIAYILTLLAI